MVDDLKTAEQAKLVPLEGLLPHLAPPDKEAQAAVQEARKKLAEAVDKIGVVSLTQAAAEKVCMPGAFPYASQPYNTHGVLSTWDSLKAALSWHNHCRIWTEASAALYLHTVV